MVPQFRLFAKRGVITLTLLLLRSKQLPSERRIFVVTWPVRSPRTRCS